MNFLHYDFNLVSDDVVEVKLDKQANTFLLDDVNFARYKRGEQYNYYGGQAKQTPARLSAPRAGHWHLVIDLGGYVGTVSASTRVIKAHHV